MDKRAQESCEQQVKASTHGLCLSLIVLLIKTDITELSKVGKSEDFK